MALCFAVAASIAALRDGIWLDEFFSLHFSMPQVGFFELLRTRWLVEYNPITSNILFWLVRLTGVDDPVMGRLALNLPALALLSAATLLFLFKGTRGRMFYPTLAALALGYLSTPIYFSEFRSYFWQLTGAVIAVQYIHFIFNDRRLADRERLSTLHVIGGLGLFLSICLHYVTGLLMSVVHALTMIALIRSGRRRAAIRMAMAVAPSWLLMLAIAYAQARSTLGVADVWWVTTTTSGAFAIFRSVEFNLLLTSPPALGLAALHLVKRLPRRISGAVPAILAATLVLGVSALLAVNAATPIIIERYMIGFAVIGVALIATFASEPLARSRIAFAAVLLWSLAVIGYQSARAPASGWEVGARAVAGVVRACPATQVLAASSWRFTPQRTTNTARIERETMAFAYQWLGRRSGFAVGVLDNAAPVQIAPGPVCPTLIWVEHLAGMENVSPETLLERGRIQVAGPHRLRLIDTNSGGVVLVDRDPRVGSDGPPSPR
ncbi:MAG TPA: hypothetical protein VF628_08305 [Allosphingosinicella sp.]